jgi:hypothetical protein
MTTINYVCPVCMKETQDQYMVTERCWDEAGLDSYNNLHLPCLEKQLGRPLVPADFTDAPINQDIGVYLASKGRDLTICFECQHCVLRPARKGCRRATCTAPWPKTINLITGELTPRYESPSEKNNGNCSHFQKRQPHWIIRLWDNIINFG